MARPREMENHALGLNSLRPLLQGAVNVNRKRRVWHSSPLAYDLDALEGAQLDPDVAVHPPGVDPRRQHHLGHLECGREINTHMGTKKESEPCGIWCRGRLDEKMRTRFDTKHWFGRAFMYRDATNLQG